MCICPPAGGGQGCGDSASPGSTASSLIRSSTKGFKHSTHQVISSAADWCKLSSDCPTSCACPSVGGDRGCDDLAPPVSQPRQFTSPSLRLETPSGVKSGNGEVELADGSAARSGDFSNLKMPQNYPNLEVGGRSAEPFTTSCCAALSGRAEALHVTLPSSVADAHAIEGLGKREWGEGRGKDRTLGQLSPIAALFMLDGWSSRCEDARSLVHTEGNAQREHTHPRGQYEIVAAAVPLPPSSTGGLQPAITHPRVVLPWLAPKRRNTSIWRPVYSIDCCGKES
ncbi:hypothetical protein EGR_05474 [Echinococcus granulosus]|uniref:Uncharacterized protein n=1 Tax=Echinococcus granulosus TaxID=6210 RepID=W6UNB8_ECHGR|nr:hypothetical protein EGR_05474 [Echinococcus granulosus]EUB59712.1 hypothetical protein EGR_05474 [Echinococcus granulosus]